MKFLMQTMDGKAVHDFTFALERAKAYYDWSGTDKIEIETFDGALRPDTPGVPPDRIPVGSVEFVSAYLLRFPPERAAALEPLNVPEALRPFAGRQILDMRSPDDLKDTFFLFRTRAFRKSMHTIKHPDNGTVKDEEFRNCSGFQLSDIIDLKSEWRALVFHDEIVHVANYGGDCTLFPDADRIGKMVKAFSRTAPCAYTLDVGLKSARDTVVVECHRFFSCGLYGFGDLKRYPFMLSQAWYEMIR